MDEKAELSAELELRRRSIEELSARDIPELVSQVYRQAPVSLRAKLLECLLRPVGPLALLVIAAGAFARFLDRLQRDAVPISLEDAARVTSDNVLELARYVQQSSPDALMRFGHLIAHQPGGFATLSGSALLMTLSIWKRRPEAGEDALRRVGTAS